MGNTCCERKQENENLFEALVNHAPVTSKHAR